MRRGLIERNTPPEWNIRVLTKDDLQEYCDAAGIEIKYRPVEQPGVYIVCDGIPTIYLNDELRGTYRLFVGFHELAHHWLHPPPAHHFFGLGRVMELEANIVAICALIPKTVLVHHWPSEIVDLFGYPYRMVQYRCDIFDRYKI